MFAGIESSHASGDETPGFVYPGRLFRELAALDLRHDCWRPGDRTLLLLRRAALAHPLAGHLARAGLDREEVQGQPELLDISSFESELPLVAIARISRWLAQVVPPAEQAVLRPHFVHHARVAERTPEVVERPVRLGPHALFGIETQPVGAAAGPVIVFLNAATEPHIGPARQWVELSRRLAEGGLRSVRVDLSGLADSPSRAGQAVRRVYAPEALDDVVDVAHAISPDDPSDIVLVGLCSGAYTALEAGRNLEARGVVAINPVLDVPISAVSPGGPPMGSIVRPRSRLGSVFLRHRRTKSVILRLPVAAWWLVHVMRLQRSPADGLRDVVSRVGDTLVICNEYDSRAYLRRGKWIVEALERTGRLRFEVVDGFDHGLLTRRSRTSTADLVVAHLTRTFGAAPAVAPTAAGPRRPEPAAPVNTNYGPR